MPRLKFFGVPLFLVLAGLLLPSSVAAGEHAVKPADLLKAVSAAAASRQAQLATINRVRSSHDMDRTLSQAGIDRPRLENAVAQLDDEDLAALAGRIQAAEPDLAAGEMGQRKLLLIILVVIIGAFIVFVAAGG